MSGDERPMAPPPLPRGAHKGSAGRLLCLAGSAAMPGAAVLVVRAAQRAGAGLVTLGAFERELLHVVPTLSPETLYLDLSSAKELFTGDLPAAITDHRHDARVVGPGLGATGRTRQLVRCLCAADFEGPLVVDADALNVAAPDPEVLGEFRGPLVLTPHPGEAERLLERPVPGDDEGDDEGRIACARELARRAGGICVLKGAGTVVTDGERVVVNATGNPGMATAGSGDVLTGILGAYLAYAQVLGDAAFGPFEAVVSAVHVHGLAGDLAARERGQRALVASDLVEFLAPAQCALEAAG